MDVKRLTLVFVAIGWGSSRPALAETFAAPGRLLLGNVPTQVDTSTEISASGSALGPAPAASRTAYGEDPDAPTGAYRHDGFYMRFAVGFAGYSERLRSEDTPTYNGRIEGNTTGIGTAGEFALGGTLGRGVVFGGAIYTTDVLAANFRTENFDDQQPPNELDPERRNLLVIGPFIDWYFRPDQGFHAQGALGFSVLSVANTGSGFSNFDVNNDPDYFAIGGALVLGFGYEWFIQREWSAGILGRATVAVLSGEDEANVRWLHVATSSPSILFTLTYH